MRKNEVLSPEKVKEIFLACTQRKNEHLHDQVETEGINIVAVFHPERLEIHKGEIDGMLNQLPAVFFEGHGESFLGADHDRNGRRWAESPQQVEYLFLLGLGSGRVKLSAPRKAWKDFPGKMPYYAIR